MTLEAVYSEHFEFVWRSLRRLGVSEDDVPDVVQDVFLIVHRKLAEFEGRSKLTTWLYGICLRVASDRRRLKRNHYEVHQRNPDSIDEHADVGAEVERREAAQFLERILDRMSLEQRAVFTLFELELMKCEDIALALEIPVGTVYSRLRLARQVFQRALNRSQAHDQFVLGAAQEGA